MEHYHTSTGRIVYDPNRGTMKRRTQWWCVINVDREITRYFRWFMERHWWEVERRNTKRSIHVPAWNAHISIIRGERPKANIEDWKHLHGLEVEFQYSLNVRQVGDTTGYQEEKDHFWFVEVNCPIVEELREYYGLPVSDWRTGRVYKPHLTIARSYDT